MQRPWLTDPEVKRLDPIWDQVRREAQQTSDREPVLASLIFATILSEPSFEDAVCHRLRAAARAFSRCRAAAQDLPSGAEGGAADRRHVPRRSARRRQARPRLPPANRPAALFQGLSRARDASLLARAVEHRALRLCALSPEPLLTHPSGRYSPRRRGSAGA